MSAKRNEYLAYISSSASASASINGENEETVSVFGAVTNIVAGGKLCYNCGGVQPFDPYTGKVSKDYSTFEICHQCQCLQRKFANLHSKLFCKDCKLQQKNFTVCGQVVEDFLRSIKWPSFNNYTYADISETIITVKDIKLQFVFNDSKERIVSKMSKVDV